MKCNAATGRRSGPVVVLALLMLLGYRSTTQPLAPSLIPGVNVPAHDINPQKLTFEHNVRDSWAVGNLESGPSQGAPVVLGPAAAPLCGEVIATSSIRGTWVSRSDDATAARVCNSSAAGIAVLCTGGLRVEDTASGPPGKVFRPRNCRLVLHAAEDARDLLRGVQVQVIGESFQRNIWKGLAVILSNDYKQGGQGPLEYPRVCGKNLQVTKSQNCLWESAFSVSKCGTTRDMVRCPIPGLQPGSLHTYIRAKTIRSLEPLCSPECIAAKNWSACIRADVLVVGLGLYAHQVSNVSWTKLATLVDAQVIAPLGRLLAAAPVRRAGATTRRRVVWMPLQSQGSRKPAQFQFQQNNGAIKPFNAVVAGAAARARIDVFDVFNITVGAYSYDGTHFGMTVGVLKAHLLINILATSIST